MAALTVAVRRDVFRSWLKISGYTRSRLAGELRVSRGRVSQLLNSDQPPSNRIIAGFLKVTHLPFEQLFIVRPRNGGRRGRTDRRAGKRPDGSGRRGSDRGAGGKR